MITLIVGSGSLVWRYAGGFMGKQGGNLVLAHGTSPKEDIHIFGAIVLRLIWLSSRASWLISACLLLLFPAVSYPAEITISWSPAMDMNVAGYRVYYGPPGQDSDFQADAGRETKITLRNLQEGASYSFVVNTYDREGRESRYSHKTTVLSLKDRDTHFLSIIPSGPPSSPSTPGPIVQEKPFPDATPGCEFAILPTSQSIGSLGGAGAVEISTKLSCLWTAVANVPWVIITSNDRGTGRQVVYYLVKANPSASSRQGTLTVAGLRFKITQAGQAIPPPKEVKEAEKKGVEKRKPEKKEAEKKEAAPAAPLRKAKSLKEVEISVKADWVKVDIKGDGLIPDYKSFQLDRPTRLVVDLPQFNNASGKTKIDVGSRLLEEIRIGQHPDKLRLVFTVPEAKLPPYQLTREGQKLKLTLGEFKKELPQEEKAPVVEAPKPVQRRR